MGIRAVITVRDDSGSERRFYQQWASKQFQVPHLAEFIGWADDHAEPFTVATYLAYAQAHPNTLPVEDITDGGHYADAREVGDLDHRYWLELSGRDRGFRYRVGDRHTRDGREVFEITEDLTSRPQLYAAAARMCEELAGRTEGYLTDHHGHLVPGWPTPQQWRDHAAAFRAREHRARPPHDEPPTPDAPGRAPTEAGT